MFAGTDRSLVGPSGHWALPEGCLEWGETAPWHPKGFSTKNTRIRFDISRSPNEYCVHPKLRSFFLKKLSLCRRLLFLSLHFLQYAVTGCQQGVGLDNDSDFQSSWITGHHFWMPLLIPYPPASMPGFIMFRQYLLFHRPCLLPHRVLKSR